MITLITRAWVMLTLLTREHREYRGHVHDRLTITCSDCSLSRE